MGDDDPFLEHGFLAALEESGSVGQHAGVVPRLVLVRDGDRLVGAVPLYLKSHSYGEFIFDWAWANGAQRAGIRYYPKLVAAIPFTPATGRRLLIAPGADVDDVRARLLAGVRAVADEERVSSVHFLFCTEDEADWLADHAFAKRLSMQFHWRNRATKPYASYEDFLSEMKSRHRKQLRHEREVAAGHGLTLRTLTGNELNADTWRALRDFYDANADKHGAHHYLTPGFFDRMKATYGHRLVATVAFRGDTPIAGTINFEKGRHLYGRYWGCLEELPMLHFELCYHRLIERAIERGYTRFEAGAQGEHKLKRGLTPALTYSAHLIHHPQLRASINDFIAREADAVLAEMRGYAELSPFRTTE